MIAVDLEYCREPEQPQTTRPDQRHDHRHDRITDTTQRTYHDIHDPAEGIRPRDDAETVHAGLNDRRA